MRELQYKVSTRIRAKYLVRRLVLLRLMLPMAAKLAVSVRDFVDSRRHQRCECGRNNRVCHVHKFVLSNQW